MRSFAIPFLLLASSTHAQVPINGPMVGHIDMLEATVWLQCHGPCNARIEYWAKDRPDSVMTTQEVTAHRVNAYALDIVVSAVIPGTTYHYRPIINGSIVDVGQPLSFKTQSLWKHRTDPPDFTVAMGSCAYINEPAYDRPGRPYGNDMRIFDRIAERSPDLMLWLGDNVYLREPDWGSRSGYLHRYTHTRSTPALQRLLRSTAHYAIWDDHDFGPNDADGSFVNSELAREVFDLFWPNPTCGAPGVPGITTSFSHGDVDFFLLDDRTFRRPGHLRTIAPSLLGNAQLDWLIQALRYSDASFKVVAMGGQVLNSAGVFENYESIPEERAELLRRIEAEGIQGVVFVSGDRHFTELSQLTLGNGTVLHDLTCSPLTSGTYSPKEVNELRVPGTLVEQHNFAELGFSGPKGARVMTMRVLDREGAMIWERAIEQAPRKDR
ncbi:MAG TPA: alkaline phosphatase D family protein [Flavobacteriales bacterium]|nr:alkaline phosphatase D family protein [Flavobacteriales bacterium]